MMSNRWRIVYAITFFPLAFFVFCALIIRSAYAKLLCGRSKYGSGRESGNIGRDRPARILCLAYMTDENASARQRIYKYSKCLDPGKVRLHIVAPASPGIYGRLYARGKKWRHYLYFIVVFLNRFLALWNSPRYDAVFLQREIMSEFFYDPPFFIFALKALNPNIIYDLDDALWILPPHSSIGKNRLLSKLAIMRFKWNVRSSKVVVASTEKIAKQARKFNPNVIVIPTLVDVDEYPLKKHREKEPVTIGWVGGGGNVKFLKLIEKPLAAISKTNKIVVRILSSATIGLKGVPVEFVKWNKETANREMEKFDIGLMPLPNNPYTAGKAGFKLLEYMAAGIPPVASAVGVNSKLIDDGGTGFLANTPDEWQSAIKRLIDDPALRDRIGRNGNAFVRENYDRSVWISTFTDALIRAVR